MNEKFESMLKDEEFQEFLHSQVSIETEKIRANRDAILEEKRILSNDYHTMKDELTHYKTTAERERSEKLNDYKKTSLEKKFNDMNVRPHMTEAVEALMEHAGGINIDDDRNISIGSGDAAQPIDDWLESFSQTDTGKNMIAIGYSTGGKGSKGIDPVKTSLLKPDQMTRDQLLSELAR